MQVWLTVYVCGRSTPVENGSTSGQRRAATQGGTSNNQLTEPSVYTTLNHGNAEAAAAASNEYNELVMMGRPQRPTSDDYLKLKPADYDDISTTSDEHRDDLDFTVEFQK